MTGPKPAKRAAWLPVAIALAGIGWGSNQFTPMLLVYARTLGLSTGTLDGLFGIYAAGLVPSLLVAGMASDARGRRPVVIGAAGVSLGATVVVVFGAHELPLLFVGRFFAGVASGMVFSAGTSWLREISLPPFGSATAPVAARRAAVAMTVGFGAGPLASGLLAQWTPDPVVTAYLPHLVVMAVALLAVAGVAETLPAGERRRVRIVVPEVALPRFRRVVAPLAPWVFAAPAVAFAFLPEILGAQRAGDGIALTAAVTALAAFSGVAIQPVARRLDAHGARNLAATAGLVVMGAGLGLAAVAAFVGQIWLLLPCAVVLGAAYGTCLVAGLVEVQALARPGGLASLTACYYALTYVGFSLPFLLALAGHLVNYPLLLLVTAVLALATAAVVTRNAADVAPTSALKKDQV
ncbi:MAG: MFS transporter [Acidimicrobiales bacterium]